MLNSTTNNYRYWIYFSSLLIMAAGLSLSKFLMSLAQIILVANWLADKELLNKLKAFIHNKPALILSSIMFLHFAGLIYTSNWEYAWKDIRIKAPLLIFPLILSTSPVLDKKHFHWITGIFIAALTVSTVISIGVFYGIIPSKKCPYPIVDVRFISIFISHIRLSLLICLAIFIMVWYIRHSSNLKLRLGLFLLAGWFVLFLTIIESLTGILIIIITITIFFIGYLWRQPRLWVKLGLTIIAIGFIISGKIYLKNVYDSVAAIDPRGKVNFSLLEKTTPRGNLYEHDSLDGQRENGHYVRQYICMKELEEAWPALSKMAINGKDSKGNEIRYTLLRFLTSKGLRKDADGVARLTDEDIHLIERGVANINYKKLGSITVRLHQVMWEIDYYIHGGNPSGHSVTQRFEYWRCALNIIRAHPLLGIGTGDVTDAYKKQYQEMNTPLHANWQLHAHNQWLAIGAAFGLLGLVWFIIALIYPAVRNKKFKDYFFTVFFIIAVFSFMNEDTLETQAGVSFFAFFYTLFLWKPEVLKSEQNSES